MTIILWPQNLTSCLCRMQKHASSNKMSILLKFLKGPEMRLKTLNRKRQNLILSLSQVLPQRWHKDQISSTLMTFSTGLGASSSLVTILRPMNSSHQTSQNSKRLNSLQLTARSTRSQRAMTKMSNRSRRRLPPRTVPSFKRTLLYQQQPRKTKKRA